MRFLHISDTHIAQSPNFVNYMHSPMRNLERLVWEINNLSFDVDFVLHTGDIVEDAAETAYHNAKPILRQLRFPVYYVNGNHDNRDHLQRIMLDKTPVGSRFDYTFDCAGVQFIVVDSAGSHTPTGDLTEAQLANLRALCVPDGPPLAIAIHHPPVALDSNWLDVGWPRLNYRHMLIANGDAFMQAIAPARARLCGVFFGHIHRSYQVLRNGILLSAAPSTFGSLLTWPGQADPEIAPHEPGGFCLVTIADGQTTVRQHWFERPANER